MCKCVRVRPWRAVSLSLWSSPYFSCPRSGDVLFYFPATDQGLADGFAPVILSLPIHQLPHIQHQVHSHSPHISVLQSRGKHRRLEHTCQTAGPWTKPGPSRHFLSDFSSSNSNQTFTVKVTTLSYLVFRFLT